jgi:hypothetical protein
MTNKEFDLGPEHTKRNDGPKNRQGVKRTASGEKQRAKREKREKELIDRKAHTTRREKGNKQDHPAVLSKLASYKWSAGAR